MERIKIDFQGNEIIIKGEFEHHDLEDIAQILLRKGYKIEYFGEEIDSPEYFDEI